MFYVVYRLTCLVNKRSFIGIHETDDIAWANPRSRLSDVYHDHAGVINKALSFTPEVKADIEKYGKQNFLVESIAGAATMPEVDRYYKRACTSEFIDDPMSYNKRVGRPKKMTK